MQHLTLKAAVQVDAELGTFEAVISSWSADREGDTIARHAFDQSLKDWQRSGKSLPLLFEHSVIAVGSLDPLTMYTDERGLIASGEIDRDTREGKQAWAQVKRGSAGFSIGFLTVKSRKIKGGQELQVVDLLECSITSTPAHPASRGCVMEVRGGHDRGPIGFTERVGGEDPRGSASAVGGQALVGGRRGEEAEAVAAHPVPLPWGDDEEPDDTPISICGVLVRPSRITFDGR